MILEKGHGLQIRAIEKAINNYDILIRIIWHFEAASPQSIYSCTWYFVAFDVEAIDR